MSVALQQVSKSFGDYPAIRDISLEAEPGEFLALLGPSGSGKTTLLRIMAGLDYPDSGTVRFDGEDVTGRHIGDRHVGFVFQHYALFPHMTVADNIGFGLSVRKRRERPGRAQIRARVEELLDLVQLGSLGGRLPAQLSGGQRQRVALARALAVDPRLLLLDEPFGALDAKVRKELRRWLRALHERVGLTSVFVTHDQDEALELADRVVVMNQGIIEQVATPDEIYRNPANPFVFDFVGEANSLPVTASGSAARFGDESIVLPAKATSDGPHLLCFRPHDVERVADGQGGFTVTATIVRRRAAGVRVEATTADLPRPVEVDLPFDQAPRQGERIHLRPRHACLFPQESQDDGKATPAPR